MNNDVIKVLAINCSPSVGGRTRTVLEAVMDSVHAAGAMSTLVELGGLQDLSVAVDGLTDGEAFVFGSPMYRATYAAPFKALLDLTPHGMFGEERAL